MHLEACLPPFGASGSIDRGSGSLAVHLGGLPGFGLEDFPERGLS